MAKKRLVLALGHDALGTNLPEQKAAVAKAAKTIADFIQNGWQVAITHGNTPQLGMIHTALNWPGSIRSTLRLPCLSALP